MIAQIQSAAVPLLLQGVDAARKLAHSSHADDHDADHADGEVRPQPGAHQRRSDDWPAHAQYMTGSQVTCRPFQNLSKRCKQW